MAKPLGIALGIVGSNTPIPPEAIIEHAKALQPPIAEKPPAAAKPKRPRKAEPANNPAEAQWPLQRSRNADGQYVGDDPATTANEAWVASDATAPMVALTQPAGQDG